MSAGRSDIPTPQEREEEGGGRMPSSGRSDILLLDKIRCGGMFQTEQELRYQLRRSGHPLADAPALLDRIIQLEREGLVTGSRVFELTEKGREAIDGQ